MKGEGGNQPGPAMLAPRCLPIHQHEPCVVWPTSCLPCGGPAAIHLSFQEKYVAPATEFPRSALRLGLQTAPMPGASCLDLACPVLGSAHGALYVMLKVELGGWPTACVEFPHLALLFHSCAAWGKGPAAHCAKVSPRHTVEGVLCGLIGVLDRQSVVCFAKGGLPPETPRIVLHPELCVVVYTVVIFVQPCTTQVPCLLAPDYICQHLTSRGRAVLRRGGSQL